MAFNSFFSSTRPMLFVTSGCVAMGSILAAGGYLLCSTPNNVVTSKFGQQIRSVLSARRVFKTVQCAICSAPPTKAHISRLMLPDDANPAGNVHGGTILHLIDQAGWAAATKYFNQARPDGKVGVAGLARIERVDFLQPMFIGEVSHVDSVVTYTSPHSIEVEVTVYAENVIAGQRRMTNRAHAWYVVKEFDTGSEPQSSFFLPKHDHYINSPALHVPQLQFEAEVQEKSGLQRYCHQREERETRAQVEASHPINGSQATLIHVILPSDCHSNGVAQAGAVLKLMDTAAGVVTVKHCRSNVVTASLEAVDFLLPVFNGDLLEIHAFPIFNSSRSMDIEVNVFSIDHLTSEKRLATRSTFTFVALDENRKPCKVPPINVTTDAQRVRWKAREVKYEQRKAARAAQGHSMNKTMAEVQSSCSPTQT